MVSPTLIRPSERRIYRLRSFLSPYPDIGLKICQNSAVAACMCIGGLKRASVVSFQLIVDPLLLMSDISDCIERKILAAALDCRRANYHVISRKSRFYVVQVLDEGLEILASQRRKRLFVEEDFALGKVDNLETDSAEVRLSQLWLKLRQQYFSERSDLDDYTIEWSGRRQTSCLASCHVGKKKVVVARAMKDPESRAYLAPLLYHEMCHAFLGEPEVVSGRRVIHGKDFKEQERRHPDIKRLNNWIKSRGWEQVVSRVEN